MSASPVSLSSSGPPETVLPPEPRSARTELAEALQLPDEERREAVAKLLSAHPDFLEGWARLGECARDPVEAYACFRVGYHRGLDRLRQHGWRGSGHVRWRHPENRGFLRSLAGLAAVAAALGEQAESERCERFLLQLDGSWAPHLLQD